MNDTSILLLEDCLELGNLTADLLRHAGFSLVRHVVSNEDAIAALTGEGFDVCIFDLRLQNDTCEPAMAAAMNCDVPVILTSGSTPEFPMDTASCVFVRKPAKVTALTDAIARALSAP